MKIAIGCDHIVTDIKNYIAAELKKLGYEVIDCGTKDKVRTHYPIYGHKVASLVAQGKVDRGVVICGTGVGISNSANKVKNIRAALVRDLISARQAVTEFDANIIACGGRITGVGLILEIVTTFLNAKYEPSKIKDARIEKINNLIKNDNYEKTEILLKDEIDKWNNGYYHD